MENALHDLRTDTIISAGDALMFVTHLYQKARRVCNSSVHEVLLYTSGERSRSDSNVDTSLHSQDGVEMADETQDSQLPVPV